jgi:uncharacterized protein with von Willebrand factor type A (vWA) domain
VSFSRAAAALPPSELYWAGRITLVSRREDLPVYDRTFREHFGGAPDAPAPRPRERLVVAAAPGPDGRATAQEATEGDETGAASDVEVLRRKRFASLSDEELAAVSRLMARIRLDAPERRTRRRRRARAGEPDLRRTLRRALRTGGEPIDRAFRARRRRRRRVVLVLDVSGSMAPYSRALLMFAHAALRCDARWEAFAFATRLTRLSPQLRAAAPDEALARLGAETADWDGGTRIGTSVARLVEGDGGRDVVRGAIVVLLSDGLDVGDPELLGAQMERLGRLAHRVVWLNPLMENPDYAPLARGMRAALPHVNVFAPGHDLASLEAVADVIARL